jgi:hypothetical protein
VLSGKGVENARKQAFFDRKFAALSLNATGNQLPPKLPIVSNHVVSIPKSRITFLSEP